MKIHVGVFLVLAVLLQAPAGAQSSTPSYVLDWLPKPESRGLLDALHARLDQWLEVVVRYTSPDIPRQSRRLWRVAADGSGPCLLAADTGVNQPRWGKMNSILFLVDADTNGDGKIDYRDEFEIRILSAAGGPSRTVGQAVSAAWSPDGRSIALVHQQQLQVIDSSGKIVPAAGRPAGQIIVADSLNPQLASEYRSIDAQTGAVAALSDDLSKKYLWLVVMSPSGTRVVYPNALRKQILIRETRATAGRKLVGGDALYLDPAWSPDEAHVVYVSTEEQGPACGAN